MLARISEIVYLETSGVKSVNFHCYLINFRFMFANVLIEYELLMWNFSCSLMWHFRRLLNLLGSSSFLAPRPLIAFPSSASSGMLQCVLEYLFVFKVSGNKLSKSKCIVVDDFFAILSSLRFACWHKSFWG